MTDERRASYLDFLIDSGLSCWVSWEPNARAARERSTNSYDMFWLGQEEVGLGLS